MATRRERMRAATIDEIKTAALGLIAEQGAAALTIRGVARAIGMSPAGLYRYYEGLDALITELITDAYNDLADAVREASRRGDGVHDRLVSAMLGYRTWAVANPNRFLLIFGTPIPGYAAPEGGPTVEANRRVGQVFFDLGAEAWSEGFLAIRPARRPIHSEELELAELVSPGLPPEAIGQFLSLWAHFHGLVTLEVLHQLDWIYPDTEAFFRAEAEAMADGLTGAAAD